VWRWKTFLLGMFKPWQQQVTMLMLFLFANAGFTGLSLALRMMMRRLDGAPHLRAMLLFVMLARMWMQIQPFWRRRGLANLVRVWCPGL
jgi:hypothetical protein